MLCQPRAHMVLQHLRHRIAAIDSLSQLDERERPVVPRVPLAQNARAAAARWLRASAMVHPRRLPRRCLAGSVWWWFGPAPFGPVSAAGPETET